MNIKQAKEYIKNSVNLYLKKDEFGEYKIPVVRQRPIFLLGAPGIGKTAIMEQIAQEMGIALVAYSMTHHTRQSALGLPFITQKVYGGETVSVSEYTMSEIIATIYDTMENSGKREGILFLDEINCVSETLSPSMLQFLQYKVFGRHTVPEGWVIVTAGNPPEYNKSVREFDVVTMDRLKILEVEPDFRIWKEYALERQVHNAIISFLELKRDKFYCMEMTTKGRSYVTARGWEDLSEILKLYEEEQLTVSEDLVGQYLRNEKVVKEFTAYYDLYHKYKKDYQIGEILSGEPSPMAIAKAKTAGFDERISLLGMLLDKVSLDMKEVLEEADVLADVRVPLKMLGEECNGQTAADFLSALSKKEEERRKVLLQLQNANSLSGELKKRHRSVIHFLEENRKDLLLQEIVSGQAAYDCIKERYKNRVEQLKNRTNLVKQELKSLFLFAKEAFAEGNEMLLLVTELTVNTNCARFIGMFGSEEYQVYSEELMLSERREDLKRQIQELKL